MPTHFRLLERNLRCFNSRNESFYYKKNVIVLCFRSEYKLRRHKGMNTDNGMNTYTGMNTELLCTPIK